MSDSGVGAVIAAENEATERERIRVDGEIRVAEIKAEATAIEDNPEIIAALEATERERIRVEGEIRLAEIRVVETSNEEEPIWINQIMTCLAQIEVKLSQMVALLSPIPPLEPLSPPVLPPTIPETPPLAAPAAPILASREAPELDRNQKTRSRWI